MSSIAINRLFSMPAFEGLRALRIQARLNTALSIAELVSIVHRIDPDADGYDFEAAITLHEIVTPGIPCEGITFYQECVTTLLLHKRPIWGRMITLGRTRFVNKLDRDERSIFREAGLLIDPPTDEVVKWWDNIKAQFRLDADQAKMDTARIGEKLSIAFEKKRLLSIGIKVDPQWTAIDDETAGYDVLSFNKNEFGLINKLIEVKSTIASPLRFFLSRNEWEKALGFKDAYHFHIWDLKKEIPVLYERTVSDIEPHIPQDNQKGKWKTVEIPVEGR